ncbi:hypothetical protein [Enterococcus sp. AZ007]|uniref:hypothetical protein n=1 Tax=Enterococcus sp. AZ007 TaxID=2774839 RepID=UPI003F1EAC82
MDNIDLILEAQDLSNAALGLDLFALDHLGSTDVNLEDINALRGIVASIKIMAETHMDHVVNQLEGTADGK